MKKGLVFFLGIITGVFLTILVGYFIGSTSSNNVKFFDEPGQVMEQTAYKVFQTFDDGTALAEEYDTQLNFAHGITVLLMNKDNESYYDEQIVKAPKGSAFRQVGLYSYTSKLGEKTVPIVSIVKK